MLQPIILALSNLWDKVYSKVQVDQGEDKTLQILNQVKKGSQPLWVVCLLDLPV
jgi:hypothetical protein